MFLAMADIRNNAEWNVIEAGDQQAIIGTLQKYLAASRALSGRTWVVQDESAPGVIRLYCIWLPYMSNPPEKTNCKEGQGQRGRMEDMRRIW